MSGLVLSITPVAINASWSRVKGDRAYRLTYTKSGDTEENAVHVSSTSVNKIIRNLLPDTDYTVKLYYSTTGRAPFTLRHTAIGHTQVNSVGNFSKEAFKAVKAEYAAPVYNIKYLDSVTSASVGVASLVSSAFTTGDRVITTATVGGSKRTVTPQIASVSGTVQVKAKNESVYVPFDESGVSNQSATLTFNDNTSKTITFDKTLNTVTIDGTVYSHGDTLILNGQRATVNVY